MGPGSGVVLWVQRLGGDETKKVGRGSERVRGETEVDSKVFTIGTIRGK